MSPSDRPDRSRPDRPRSGGARPAQSRSAQTRSAQPRPAQPRPTQSGRGRVLAGAAVAAVLALVVGGIVWQQQRSAPVNPDYGPSTAAVSVADGVVRVGAPDAPVTLDVYEDFLCPACEQFETQYGGALALAMDDGEVAVRYHQVDFLSGLSASGDYSRRASAAALCVASDGDGSAYTELHHTLYGEDVIPEENSDADLTDAQLADFAVAAGASESVRECITSGAQLETVDALTESAVADLQAAGTSVGTPTVLRDGQVVDRTDRGWVDALG